MSALGLDYTRNALITTTDLQRHKTEVLEVIARGKQLRITRSASRRDGRDLPTDYIAVEYSTDLLERVLEQGVNPPSLSSVTFNKAFSKAEVLVSTAGGAILITTNDEPECILFELGMAAEMGLVDTDNWQKTSRYEQRHG